jgi:hypothetical protein
MPSGIHWIPAHFRVKEPICISAYTNRPSIEADEQLSTFFFLLAVGMMASLGRIQFNLIPLVITHAITSRSFLTENIYTHYNSALQSTYHIVSAT